MTPFYFGARRRRLFGLYEPAAAARGSRRAAVLCHPWGDEYIHAHRTVRQLAARLAGAGVHTLRFDYFGTGDSGGDMEDADLAGWEDDIETAMDELRSIVGSARVILIGLRLGATLAARIAARNSEDVDSLVLWDPVLSGPDYLSSLGAAVAPADPDATSEVRGFPLTARMRCDLAAIALSPPLCPAGVRGMTLVTEGGGRPEQGNEQRCDTIEFMTATQPWIEDPEKMGAIPFEAIRRIVTWLD